MRLLHAFVVSGAVLLSACSAKVSNLSSNLSLTIQVSNKKTVTTTSLKIWEAISPLLLGPLAYAHGGTAGNPTKLTGKIFAAYASPNADCTSSVMLAESVGGVSLEFLDNPLLYTVDSVVAKCLVVDISDNFAFRADADAAAAFPGVCATATDYTADLYRVGATVVKDRDGVDVIASGSDLAPAEDRLSIFISTDPAAVTAGPLAISNTYQLRTLSADLIEQRELTFFADFTGHLNARGGACVLDAHNPFGVRY